MTTPSRQGYGPAHPTRNGFSLHHVQLAIPVGSEETARAFWVRVLGFVEVPKPPELAARGGLWVRADDLEIHLGAEKDFTPAHRAHPGVLVHGLDRLAAHLEENDVEVRWDGAFPGHRRFYCSDPFGNRLEFLEPEATDS